MTNEHLAKYRPELLAFRKWACEQFSKFKNHIARGNWDKGLYFQCYLAGARMAREQERERAKVLLRGLEDIVDADQDEISHMARAALAKYEGTL